MPTAALKRVKRLTKSAWTNAQRSFVEKFYSFTPADLAQALAGLGIRQGDVLFVHSSFDRFRGFRGRLSDVIRVLEESVGAEGTLLMPTLPFDGSAADYVRSGKITDLARTPSQTGILTEVFRRQVGVARSVHPTHPVAAWGARRDEMLKDHALARTPCGSPYPYSRLIDTDAKILMAGVGIAPLTFFHTVEELLEPDMPFSPFTPEWYTAQVRDAQGDIHTAKFRLYAPGVSKRRNLGVLIPKLKELGGWHTRRVGRLELTLLDARKVVEACRALAAQGIFCYRD